MRLIFAGTPASAVPSLQALLDSSHEVTGVITRPDAPSGRGRRLTPSPVRVLAEEHGIDVLTPASLRRPEALDWIRQHEPEAAPVVAYGGLVPPSALEIPRLGWVNLHFSLLPQWRGAAPAQRAVLAGQTSTGITVFQLAEGLDTGDVIASEPTPIGPEQTAGELLEAMATQGAPLLVSALDALAAGTARLQPQDDASATHAPKLSAAEARIDFSRPAAAVSAQIRGMSPDPGAWTLLGDQRIKVLGVSLAAAPPELALAPGQLHATKREVFVGTGSAPLALGTVAAPGKRPMPAPDWARGASLTPEARFTPATTATEETR